MDEAKQKQITLSFLAEYDGPCPHCGFHLKYPQANTCSECGRTLKIVLRKRFTCSSWLLFMFGIVATIGVCIDQAGLFFAARLYQGSPLIWKWILPELILIALLTCTLIGWWKLKTRVMGLRPPLKICIGIVGVLMPFFWFNVLFWLFVITF
jgi:hypothetical protein